VDRFVPDLRRYADRVSGLKEDLAAVARRHAGADVEIALNAADDLATSNVYLTVTGTSGESGDDGQVGRGNRVNGLIAPYRPMTLEAAAGKNPVAHVGKLYNLAAHRIASAVAEEIAPVIRCHCHLASRIGRPIGDPEVVDLSVRLERGVELNDVTGAISEIARKSIAEIGTLWEKLIAGEIHVF
jgi:S-adenosylmethionine synthetase